MTFSIIIPVYNCENTLHISVESIIRQTYSNWELILVNDGSTDGSFGLCQEYAKKDPRIIVVNQANMGPGASRNNGIKIAKGEYLVFCDADDFMLPNALNNGYHYISTYEWDIIIWGYHDAIIQNGNIVTIGRHETDCKEYHSNSDFRDDYLYLDNLAFTYPVWNKFYRRKNVLDLNASFPTETFVAEDFIFNLQLYTNVNNILLSEKVSYMYIHHDYSITSAFIESKLMGIEYVYLYAIGVFSKWNPIMVNEIRNAFVRDISVYINNMFNKNVTLKLSAKRKLIKKIVNMDSVRKCVNNINPISLRNKVTVFLIKLKMIDLLLLTGKLARLKKW